MCIFDASIRRTQDKEHRANRLILLLIRKLRGNPHWFDEACVALDKAGIPAIQDVRGTRITFLCFLIESNTNSLCVFPRLSLKFWSQEGVLMMCCPHVQALTRHVPQNWEEASILAFKVWEVSSVCRSTETLRLANHHQCVSTT